MDEMIEILKDIKYEMERMNDKLDDLNREICNKLDDIQGIGLNGNSISDVCDTLDSLQGSGLFSSISDVCDKIDDLIR